VEFDEEGGFCFGAAVRAEVGRELVGSGKERHFSLVGGGVAVAGVDGYLLQVFGKYHAIGTPVENVGRSGV